MSLTSEPDRAVTFEIAFDACLSAGAATTEKKW
jgi:hypothetical protein